MRLSVDVRLAAQAPLDVVMTRPLLTDAPLDEDRWTRYAEAAHSLFELSSLDRCDFAVLPFPWQLALEDDAYMHAAHVSAHEAREAGKELIVFYQLDDETVRVDLPNTLVFKTSLLRSRRRSNEFAQPAWVDDLLARFCSGRLAPRAKNAKPTIGFCGYAPPNGIVTPAQYVKERLRSVLDSAGIARWLGISPAMTTRARTIAIVSASDAVTKQFLFRDDTYVDEYGNVGPYNQSVPYRTEYVANTLSSDYVLCTRGWGNFSFRLYETLCLGRIPVFVDTDCVLPADDKIDWQSLCVYVGERELKQLPEAVLTHYDAMSADAYVDHQRRCREVWEAYLSPLGYFRYLREQLFGRLNQADVRHREP